MDTFNKQAVKEAVYASQLEANSKFEAKHPVEHAQVRAIDLHAELAAWYVGERNEGTDAHHIIEALAAVVGGSIFNMLGEMSEEDLLYVVGKFASEVGNVILMAKAGGDGVIQGSNVKFSDHRTQ